ncbi:hypothetical protein BX070DRAFT_14892 [Coemansia spiralis]|nr:hypothetical protein BX070DRAFT_14892 [Coemansia spiralis]
MYTTRLPTFLLTTCAIVMLHHPDGAAAVIVTCAAFQGLSKITYNSLTPQTLSSVIIAFEPNTTSQAMDSYSDALQCRGSTVSALNYNTQTLIGYVAQQFFSQLQGSKYVAAVEPNGQVSTLQMPSGQLQTAVGMATASSSRQSSLRSVANTGLETGGVDSNSESHSASSGSGASRATNMHSSSSHTAVATTAVFIAIIFTLVFSG